MRSRHTVVAALILLAAALGVIRVRADEATPVSAPTTLTLVEHADRVTTLDLGHPGPSVGDMIVWGPDSLFDRADENDTGATTQGTCTTFGDDGACILNETIVFDDGSTLELYGI